MHDFCFHSKKHQSYSHADAQLNSLDQSLTKNAKPFSVRTEALLHKP